MFAGECINANGRPADPQMLPFDSRGAKRYRLAVPVSYWWPEGGNSIRSGEGITRDVSNDGVLIRGDCCPPAGVRIELKLLLPGADRAGRGMELRGEGFVIRVKPEVVGSAASLKEFAAAVNLFAERACEYGPAEDQVEPGFERISE